MDWGGVEIAIEIQCDAGHILTKTGRRAQIGICGFSRKQITDDTKNVEFQQGNAVSWAVNKSPMASTSSYDGAMQERFYGLDFARMSKCLLEELTFRKYVGGNTDLRPKR